MTGGLLGARWANAVLVAKNKEAAGNNAGKILLIGAIFSEGWVGSWADAGAKRLRQAPFSQGNGCRNATYM